MEFLKSQLSLRSMDMEGRSLGTERSSVSPGASNRSSGAGAASGRFTSLLQSRTAEGTRTTRQARESIEDDFAARIRDGRTDAARETPRRASERPTGERADGQKNVEAGPEQARPAGRQGRQTGSKRRQGAVAAPAGNSGTSGISSRERGLALTDAADAQGASAELDTTEDAPLAPFLQQVDTPPPPGPAVAAQTGAASVARVVPAAVGNPALSAGVKAGPQTTNPTVTPALRADAVGKAARVQQAAPKPGSTAMQRADAILDQLRVHIRAGDREAIIQLNPVELGRMRLHVKVNGSSVAATIGAESAETLALLEAHAPELRSWLARDGVETVELELELLTSSEDEGRSSSERADTDGKSSRGRRGRATTIAAPQLGPATESLVQSLASHSADGGVDLVA